MAGAISMNNFLLRRGSILRLQDRVWIVSLAMLAALESGAEETPAFPLENHVNQKTITEHSFTDVFGWGQKLFNASYNSLDGVGANLSADDPISIRFSRVPRADLPGFQANPIRVTGPSASRCADCHEPPTRQGANGVVDNEPRDPFKTGDPSKFIMRGAPHIFGSGALQRLAEEATVDLKAIRERTLEKAARLGQPVTAKLVTGNRIIYGRITALPSGEIDTSEIEGVDTDLVVKPYQLKGSVASLRLIVLGPSDNSLGMQPVEFFGWNTDFDADGVTNEFTPGDITAITSYVAAQPRPVSKLELHYELGGKYRLGRHEIYSIKKGERLFDQVGCADCHSPKLKLRDSVFTEPSRYPEYRFSFPPSGIDPVAEGLDPENPIWFDLTSNPVTQCRPRFSDNGGGSDKVSHEFHKRCVLQFESAGSGGAIVRLYGDLKRHDMGAGLAESVDEVGTGASVWKTRELWGVGSTGPWLHDGRATTLTEAILHHGGEALASRDEFFELSKREQAHLVDFLKNLVIYSPERP